MNEKLIDIVKQHIAVGAISGKGRAVKGLNKEVYTEVMNDIEHRITYVYEKDKDEVSWFIESLY